MSVTRLDWAARDESVSGYDKLVLMLLAEAADSATGETFIGQDTVAKRAGISLRRVVMAMASLEKAGLITRRKRFLGNGNRTSDLTVVRPDAPSAPGPCADGGIDHVHAVHSNPHLTPR